MRKLVLAVVLAVAPMTAFADPPQTHEILSERPSGFWTSNRPAVGGAYRYRLLGIGVAIAGIMGLVMVRIVKRANADRAQRR